MRQSKPSESKLRKSKLRKSKPRKRGKPRQTRKAGFAEDPASYTPSPLSFEQGQATVELSAGGRIVIPAPMRARLGMQVGDRLTLRVEGSELRIQTYEQGLRRAREIVAQYLPPGADPLDEFLKWRREQAALEQARLDRRGHGD